MAEADQRAEVELDLLKAVLELAVVIAQAGQRVTPAVTPPAALRPYLRFTRKVPPPALRVARRVLDTDEEWRARVAVVVTDDLVGRAGVLYAQRPEGWADEFESLCADAMAVRRTTRSDVAERDAERRLSAAAQAGRRSEAAARAADEALARLRVELVTAQAGLQTETARRHAAETRAAELTAELTEAEAARRTAESERDTLLRAHDELLVVEREAGDLDAQRAALLASADVALDGVQALHTALIRMRADLSVEPEPAPRPAHVPPTVTPSRAERSAVRRAEQLRGNRAPVALPRAVFDDSAEASRHLLRVPGILVLVDGYNVAKWRWASVPPRDLRARLGGALADIAARTDAEICVVYDGVDEGGALRPLGAARVPLRVVFSSGAVEADDVIIDMVARTPATRSVVVVSSDRRIRDAVVRMGANVLTSRQFVDSWG